MLSGFGAVDSFSRFGQLLRFSFGVNSFQFNLYMGKSCGLCAKTKGWHPSKRLNFKIQYSEFCIFETDSREAPVVAGLNRRSGLSESGLAMFRRISLGDNPMQRRSLAHTFRRPIPLERQLFMIAYLCPQHVADDPAGAFDLRHG